MSAFARVSAMQAQPPVSSTSPRCHTCQFTAEGREQLRQHYKSEWHVHNSRRRAAEQPPVSKKEFAVKLRKAKAQQLEQQQRQEQLQQEAKRLQEEQARRYAEAEENEEEDQEEPEPEQDADEFTSVFDQQKFGTVEANMSYCHRRYGLFIPDREYLTDAAGLMTYLNMKVKAGHVCLYCQRGFPSAAACQRHMIDVSHCKLLYDEDVDMHEYEEFYDFSSSYNAADGARTDGTSEAKQPADDGDAEGGDDVEADIGPKFQISDIGELVLLDGRTVGHRDLQLYYKQNVRPKDNRVAIVEQKKNILAKIAPTTQLSYEQIQTLTIPQIYAAVKARQKIDHKVQKRREINKARNESRIAGKFTIATLDPASQAMKRRDFNTPR